MLELSIGVESSAAPLGDVDASVAALDRDNAGVAAAAGSAAGFEAWTGNVKCFELEVAMRRVSTVIDEFVVPVQVIAANSRSFSRKIRSDFSMSPPFLFVPGIQG